MYTFAFGYVDVMLRTFDSNHLVRVALDSLYRVLLRLFTPVCRTMFLYGPILAAHGIASIFASDYCYTKGSRRFN